jgi:transposase InsO family protein
MADEGLPVEVACRVLAVSCSGFYAWRFRPPSARAVRHAWLTDVIREVHAASYGNYGAKRVHAEVVLGRGINVGHNAVAMLMQRAGIAGRGGARTRSGVPGVPTADDLFDRMFAGDPPNQLWLTDVTEHPTREGKVYCAFVLDAFSRRVVGWSISHNPTAALTCNALGKRSGRACRSSYWTRAAGGRGSSSQTRSSSSSRSSATADGVTPLSECEHRLNMNYSTPHQRPPESRKAAPPNQGHCAVSTEPGEVQSRQRTLDCQAAQLRSKRRTGACD